MSRALLKSLFLGSTLLLPSCGTMDLVRKTTASTTQKIGELSKFSVTDLMPAKVKVVEVREKDLKDLPLGEDRALAYEAKKRRSFWFFDGPVDFKEPELPTAGAELDGSLLPPKPN
jgi:hypothetical protein